MIDRGFAVATILQGRAMEIRKSKLNQPSANKDQHFQLRSDFDY